MKRVLGLVPQAVPPRVVLERSYPCRLGVLINSGKMRALSAILSVLLGARHARLQAADSGSHPGSHGRDGLRSYVKTTSDSRRMLELAKQGSFAKVLGSLLAGAEDVDTTEPEEPDPKLPQPAPVSVIARSVRAGHSGTGYVAPSTSIVTRGDGAERGRHGAARELVYPYLLDFASWAAGGVGTSVMSGIRGDELPSSSTAVPASLL